MDRRLLRAYLVELVATFGFVLVAGGLACVTAMATPANADVGSTPVTTMQPGLLGVALGQALVWFALAAWSAPISGGYMNPAITIARWVFGQMSSPRMAWFVGAQVAGAVAAGLALMAIFKADVLTAAKFGTPSLNELTFPNPHAAVWTGLGIEVLLTFFLVLVIFRRANEVVWLGAVWLGATVLVAATLFAGPLTGASLNPARWFGPAFWQMLQQSASGQARFALVYVAGPIVGALLAGAFAKAVYEPALADGAWDGSPTRPAK